MSRRLTAENGEQWDIVAAEHGQFVIAPVVHGGAVENITAAALKARFGVEAEAPEEPDEPAAWAAFGQAWRADCWLPSRGGESAGPTPEERFAFASTPADD